MEVFFYVERVKLIRVCQKQRELSMLHTYKDSLKEFWLLKYINIFFENESKIPFRLLWIPDFDLRVVSNYVKLPDQPVNC